MAKDLINKLSTKRKEKNSAIFNFPLSQETRNKLEVLATMAEMSLAGVIRHSINVAYDVATTSAQETASQNKITALETVIAIHHELAIIKANTNSILTTMATNKEATPQLAQLTNNS